jgi:membrane protein DedA with SNARE-associated domain
VLGSLGYVLHQRNRGRHTAWSRRISLVIVLVVLVVLVVGLTWIW